MGLETAAALGLGGAAINAIGGYFDNVSARKRSKQVADQGAAITGAPLPGMGDINTGQDSFLQYLRANPKGLDPLMFNQSDAFKGLQANDAYQVNDQVNQLRAGAGSLGARFGSGFASRESNLRSRFAASISARNAGISQNSFNTALQYGFGSFQNQQAQKNNMLQFILQQRGQQLQALGLGAQQPYPSTVQPVGQGMIDIAQLMYLSKFLTPGQTPQPPQ